MWGIPGLQHLATGKKTAGVLIIIMWKGVHKAGFTFKKQVIGPYVCKFTYVENN